MKAEPDIAQELQGRFRAVGFTPQATCNGIPTLWVTQDRAHEVRHHPKSEIEQPYRRLCDLTAIDEWLRPHREGQPPVDFTVV